MIGSNAVALRSRLDRTIDALLPLLSGPHADALIAALDTLDGDPDLEPSLGSPEISSQFQVVWAYGGLDDFEEEHDGRELDVSQ